MLLYNNPGRVGYTMSGNLVERLAHEVKNIVGRKIQVVILPRLLSLSAVQEMWILRYSVVKIHYCMRLYVMEQ